MTDVLPTISEEKIQELAKALHNYRGTGHDTILFDTRDPGNYGAYYWDLHSDMLMKADPTGLSLGMLLAEMVEATIRGSKVKLDRVLREPGFLSQLYAIQNLERELLSAIAKPRATLLRQLTDSLQRVSPDFEAPSTREVAICIRDAVYSISTGLTLRWLECRDVDMPSHLRLCPEIRRFDTVADFVDGLRTELPLGAHLARIGIDHTAIGMKSPGRVAYLSSLCISRGSMQEGRATNHHMAESLDLDTAVERYPEWMKYDTRQYGGSSRAIPGPSDAGVDHIASLPRDRLLWLAMVVEMGGQMMSAATSTVELVETMSRALPESPAVTTLPAVIQPNWRVAHPEVQAVFNSFGFAPWEAKFLAPALEGLDHHAFLRVGGEYSIDVVTKAVADWSTKNTFMSFDRDRLVRLTGVEASLTGTRAEVENAREALFGKNLVTWLMAWGNYHFMREHTEMRDWFKSALTKNLPKALSAVCVSWKTPEFKVENGLNLYRQNSKRVGYSPRCLLTGKEVDRVAHFIPDTAQDLVEMLGLSSEGDLPKFLQGWAREQSWTTTSGQARSTSPYLVGHRWCFSERVHEEWSNRFVEATVNLNQAALNEVSRVPAAKRKTAKT